MKLSKEQERSAELLSYFMLYAVGGTLIFFNFEVKLNLFLFTLGCMMVMAGYYSSGKNKAIRQLKERYNIKEEVLP